MKILHALNQKILVYDGAMGTSIQKKALSEDDFWGNPDCNEILNLSAPKIIEEIHASFLEVGCDIIETNTFNGSAISLSDHNLADKTYEINKRAAEIANQTANDFSTDFYPRFVAGSIGPTSTLPSLCQIGFDAMLESYKLQISGLVDGGVDLLIIETCQDSLQMKIAVIAALDVFAEKKVRLPIHVSVTIDTTGNMLLGTDIAAAMTTILDFPIDIIGINCSTGPDEMSETLRYLSQHSPLPIAAIPNAGFPKEVDDQLIYDMTPSDFSSSLRKYVTELGVNIVGGCCGTTPDHLKAVVETVSGEKSPPHRNIDFAPSVSSLFSRVLLDTEPKPLLIGERTNANGSKTFRELLKAEDYEKMITFANGQVRKGAHALDVCVSIVGKNEVDYINAVIPKFNQHIDSPLMIDSTDPIAIEEALKRISGKAMVNSVNLENGEEGFAEILRICKRYGAAVVALTIDEAGMAKSADKKFEIAKRIHDLAVDKYDFDPNNILYDPLTFTLATGDESSQRMGIETLNAIKLIKENIPQSQVILGVSNISYGLPSNARKALNSVFLHEAISAGLDLAIFNVAHFLPLHKLDEQAINLSLNLIHNKKESALSDLMEYFSEAKIESEEDIEEELSPEETLMRKVMDGEKSDLEKVLERALNDHAPSDILNQILLPAMETVGERFGNGEMPLPFVLQSAEVMKTAVTILEPKMDMGESEEKGKLLLATVKGDVHDIGKNLVNIILSNNGFDVVDLGIRQSISNIIAGIKEYQPDALGMSGLLVKSTVIMKENLQILNEHGISIPVIVGGAALSRSYVDIVLQNVYRGRVYYAKDAFEGLKIMRELSIYRRFP